MPTLVDEEVCEIHFLDTVPKSTCAICSKKSAKKSRVRIAGIAKTIVPSIVRPKKPVFMWDPQRLNVRDIPIDRDIVHITRTFSMDEFRQLAVTLPGLVIVEVIPSSIPLVEANIEWFTQFNVGITAQCRK